MRILVMALLGGVVLAVAGAIAMQGGEPGASRVAEKETGAVNGKGMNDETLVIGGGCFWCLEPLFEMVKGVSAVESGYAGGRKQGVSYEEVCMGTTGHAEVVKISYDPKVVSGDDLLRLFFTMHDPTTKDQQGGDVGPQYRSVIFYETDAEKERAQRIILEIDREKIWPRPIVTTLEPLKNYTVAESYHQDYYNKFSSATMIQKMQMNSGYCKAIIEPKVRKFREKYRHLLKG